MWTGHLPQVMMSSESTSNDATFDPRALPTAQQIAKARSLDVFDSDGSKVRFGDLIDRSTNPPDNAAGTTTDTRKLVVVFIRHFNCGMCQASDPRASFIPFDAQQFCATKQCLNSLSGPFFSLSPVIFSAGLCNCTVKGVSRRFQDGQVDRDRMRQTEPHQALPRSIWTSSSSSPEKRCLQL
jgi:hypothetical protein